MNKSSNEAKASNGTVNLTVKSTFGNFDYIAQTTVSREVIETAANKGFLWELQRSPAGAAEFAITGFDGKTAATTKPADWTRTDIAYTEANAAVIRKALSDRGNFAKGSFLPADAVITVSVSEHVATAVESKWSKARAIVAGHLGQFGEGMPAVLRVAKKIGYTAKAGEVLNDSNESFVAALGQAMAAAKP